MATATATPPSDPLEQVDQPESNNESQQSAEKVPPASSSLEPASPSSADWQAIWSPAHNAYYFYNTVTQQTTWVNPLQPAQDSSVSSTPTLTAVPTLTSTSTSTSTPPPPSASASTQEEGPSSSAPGPSSGATTHVPASVAQIYALQEAAAAQGIDPSLAHLDPSLAGPSAPGFAAYNFSARFNAHTGAFTRPDGRDPTHLSEYERMKRMSSVYFDMGQWEQDVAQRKEQEDEDAAYGKKRKRPSKKDLVRPPHFLVFFFFFLLMR